MVVANDVIHDPRVLKEARALAEAGHTVAFIGWDRTASGPEREEWNGFVIRRVRTTGLMRLLWKDLFRNVLWWRRAYRLAMSEPFDAVHVHDLDALPIGVRIKRSTGKPLIYDCHEIFHKMVEQEVPGFIRAYIARLERRLAPVPDRIIVVSPVVADYFREISGRDTLIVANYPDFVLDAYRPPPSGAFTVVYLGNLHASRFILPAIEVIADLPDARMVIAGSGLIAAQVKAACAPHPNTPFLGTIPNDRVMDLVLQGHVMLSMLDSALWTNQVGMPNKVFEAMASGRPSIVTAGSLISEVVERERCGLAVPYTKEGFRDAVVRLRDDPRLAEELGRNGLAAARREYTWMREKEKLVRLYADLAGSR